MTEQQLTEKTDQQIADDLTNSVIAFKRRYGEKQVAQCLRELLELFEHTAANARAAN